MDHPGSPGGRPPRKELQGPRPTPLKVHKESRKIRKPSVAPPSQQPPVQQTLCRQPVVIYTVSPKVIHTQPSEFMTLVQRLTGPDSTPTSASASTSTAASSVAGAAASSATADYSASGTSDGAMWPAAHFSVMERTKESMEGKISCNRGGHLGVVRGGIGDLLGGGRIGWAGEIENRTENPGILSPGHPISTNHFFSPLTDPFTTMMMKNLYQDLNPVQHDRHGSSSSGKSNVVEGNTGNCFDMASTPTTNSFNSPGTIISPASLEFLNEFLNN